MHSRSVSKWFLYGVLGVSLAFLPGAAGKDKGHADGERGASERFKGLDRNNDGRITRDEWRGNDRSFAVHDRNADGVLAGAEVGSALQAEGYDDFLAIDRNRDGRISREEWHWDRSEFDRLDDNRDGSLTRAEYMDTTRDGPDSRFSESRVSIPAAYTPSAAPVPEDRSARFNRLDRNNNGLISHDEWDGDRKDFNVLDDNDNGALSRDEFLGVSRSTHKSQFKGYDLNGNGVISRAEWKGDKQSFSRLDMNNDDKLMREEFVKRYDELEQNFSKMDRDRNGQVSRQEWRSGDKAFANLDDNKDNQISLAEFVGVN